MHPFDSTLVAAVEFLRTHYGKPWRVTSSYRTESNERQILHDLHVPYFEDEHMRGNAVDSQPVEYSPAIMADLTREFFTNGPVYQHLRQIGVNGFGLYDTFIHLDVRTEKRFHRDAFGLVAHWDSRRVNAESPWGVAFSNQKKSVGVVIPPKLNPNRTPNPLPKPLPIPPPGGLVGAGPVLALLRG